MRHQVTDAGYARSHPRSRRRCGAAPGFLQGRQIGGRGLDPIDRMRHGAQRHVAGAEGQIELLGIGLMQFFGQPLQIGV